MFKLVNTPAPNLLFQVIFCSKRFMNKESIAALAAPKIKKKHINYYIQGRGVINHTPQYFLNIFLLQIFGTLPTLLTLLHSEGVSIGD